MKKSLGLLLLLLLITALSTYWSYDAASDSYLFLSPFNLENLLHRVGLFGLLSLAAAFVIVTGGIDLSIGATVCVAGCLLPYCLVTLQWPAFVALPAVLLVTAGIGAWHGLLITRVGLQPFVVTLCGLLLYRGAMREFAGDQTMGLGEYAAGLRVLATGRVPLTSQFGLPAPLLILVLLALVTAVVWTKTVWGRHLFALGRNEEAARFSGVRTKSITLLAYTLCGLIAGLAGCLFLLDVNSAQPSSFGTFYELYAIAGAVLGGVMLRGGEGTVLGVVLGAALMQLLPNAIRLLADSDRLEFAVVGGVILCGALADEGLRRFFLNSHRP